MTAGSLTDRIASAVASFREDQTAVAAGAALVTKSGAVAVAVDGVTAKGDTDRVAPEDAWHIGSCTKAVTALTIATLVEDRMIDWNAPIANMFTDIEGVDQAWTQLSVADLLHCRAGIRANIPISDMSGAHDSTATDVNQRTDLAKTILSAPTEPGRFVYSNVSYILAGALIDRVAGTPYELAVAERVMKPLGVTDFGFGAPPRIAGHRRTVQVGPFGVGRLIPKRPEERASDNPALYSPAGRLHLPLAQWAKFVSLFLGSPEPLVGAESIQRLLEPPAGEHFAMGWGRHPHGGSFMQGSNTLSGATVRMQNGYGALVVVSDAREKVLRASATFADQLLSVLASGP